MKKNLSILLTCIALILFAAALTSLYLEDRAQEKDSQKTEALKPSETSSLSEESSIASSETASSEEVIEASSQTEESSLVEEPEPIRVANPYQDAFLENPDMAAWIQVEGMNIDYPVMWTPADEEYYLYKAFDGSYSKSGCLILDTDSCVDPLTTNLIIHGHNMKSGAMFGNLTDYEKESFYKDHKIITLYTKEKQRNYEVIAVFRSQVYKKTDKVFKFYQFFQADTEEEFQNFYDNIKALSIYDTGVEAQFGDHFLTLSTCAYHVANGRFVVVAKELEGGDFYLPVQQ